MEICRQIEERPRDFYSTEYVLKDTKTGVSYWIANGFSYYGIYTPQRIPFTFKEKWKFHRALKKGQKGMKTYLARV